MRRGSFSGKSSARTTKFHNDEQSRTPITTGKFNPDFDRRTFLKCSALSTLALATPSLGVQKGPIRIVVAGIHQEANTMRGDTTKLSDSTIKRGEEIIRSNTGVRGYIGGMIDAAQRVGAELVPVFVVRGGPGPFERDAYEALVKELIERTVSTPNVSGVALPLHGAGVVEGIGSLEADLWH